MKKILPALLFSLCVLSAKATHIVGGYLSYRFISGTTYEITLTIYRDCTSATVFDGAPGSTTPTAVVGVFNNATGTYVDTISFINPVITSITPPTNNPCLVPDPSICVEQGVYKKNYTFPSQTTGYFLTHERCCRNGGISNVFDAINAGAVYSAYIPPTNSFQNSSPTFATLPPLFVCVNAPFSFNYSATDADGDVLTYSLCTPSSGGTPADPAPRPPYGPPYSQITWESGYSLANLTGGTPPLTINTNSGVMSGTPNTIGKFVVGVCVSEYRGGNLIGTYLRDYQINVIDCQIPIAAVPSANIDPITGIGTYIINCSNTFVQFQNSSYNPPVPNIPLSYQWDFGVTGITSDTSTAFEPSYNYPDTGTYLVKLIVVKGTGSGACTDTTFAYVKIYSAGTAAFNAAGQCPNVPVQFNDNSTTSYGTLSNWNWNFGDGNTSTLQNPTHAYAAGGNYTVTLISTNSFGCKDTVQNPLTIFVSGDAAFGYTPPCINTPVSFAVLDTANITTYSWTLSNGSTSSVPNPVYTYTAAGTYSVSLQVTSANGCWDTASATIVVQLPVSAAVDSAANACAGYPVQLSASGGLYYHWLPETGLSNPFSASPVATIDSNTTFTVIVSNDCFSDTSTVDVFIRPLPTVTACDDTAIYRDTYASLYGTTNGISYFWNPSTWLDEPFSLSTKAEPRETTWYELYAVNEWGCVNMDSVLVTVIYENVLDIPTAFSPNGDGVNDVFRIVRWLNVTAIREFSVFNRWGQKVFSTNDIAEGWDGTYRHQKADMGVYVWLVVARTGDGKEFMRSGNVTLVR